MSTNLTAAQVSNLRKIAAGEQPALNARSVRVLVRLWYVLPIEDQTGISYKLTDLGRAKLNEIDRVCPVCEEPGVHQDGECPTCSLRKGRESQVWTAPPSDAPVRVVPLTSIDQQLAAAVESFNAREVGRLISWRCDTLQQLGGCDPIVFASLPHAEVQARKAREASSEGRDRDAAFFARWALAHGAPDVPGFYSRWMEIEAVRYPVTVGGAS